MKKYFFVLITFICSLPLFAKVEFRSFDINSSDQVVYTFSQDMVGSTNYETLCLATLTDNSIQNELLSFFPEQMELLDSDKILQIRNRYGKFQYNIHSGEFLHKSNFTQIPQNPIPVLPYSVSSDGQWVCYIEKTDLTFGRLILKNVKTSFSKVLCEKIKMSYSAVPVKWSREGSILLYENGGTVYFCKPEAIMKGVEIEEKYRKIGTGSINSVEFASDKYIVYVDDCLLYKINVRALYTMGLYSGIIGNGQVVGRLPFSFDYLNDKFSTNEDVSSIFIVQNKKNFSYLTANENSVDYMNVDFSRPYTDSDASLVDSFVFWTKSQKPILWLEKLPYDKKENIASVYKISSSAEKIFEIEDFSKPYISPDKSKVAFSSGTSFFVYDISSWQKISQLSGERVVSAVWLNDDTIFVGGEYSVKKWQISTSTTELIALSRLENAFWYENQIICQNPVGFFSVDYKTKKVTLLENFTKSENVNRTQSENYRVFTGTCMNSNFKNAIYVRTLFDKPVTKPIYAQCVKKVNDAKKVSIVFDVYNNADGLATILTELKKYNIDANFFINGEFVRRYPLETRQIANNGFSCGSMFFTITDLITDDFIIDESFIRRGLAKTEDEFYGCTASELNLYWHAPFYSVSNEIIEYSKKAGYSYIDAKHIHSDVVKNAKNLSVDQLLKEYISDIQSGKSNVVPICVGFSNHKEMEPLYDYLDLIICALIDANFEIVALENQ